MKIHINLALILNDWHTRHGVAGPALVLGFDGVEFTRNEFARALDHDHQQDETTDEEAPWGIPELFAMMGFPEVETARTIDALPKSARGYYGFVISTGVLEKNFHIPNVLANLDAMLCDEGCIAHLTRCDGAADGSFYRLSPHLLDDYHAAMGDEVLESAAIVFDPLRHEGHRWEVFPATRRDFARGWSTRLSDRAFFRKLLIRKGTNRRVDAPQLDINNPVQFNRGPRWFPTYELRYGTRIDRPNQLIVPLRHFTKGEGLSWTVAVPEFTHLSESNDRHQHSSLILLENDAALGPAHSTHAEIRTQGGGAFSHWGGNVIFSTSDGSDPYTNGRTYVAILPHASIRDFLFDL